MRIHFRPKLLDCLGNYNTSMLLSDVSAGITVGVLALPLAMAFAIASGMSPTAGIWTAIVAGFIISTLGGSRVQIGGPTGAFIPIVYGIVVQYGVQNLLIATMMAGLMLLAMGFFRLGNLIRFIPVSVVIGFTNGIAVVIFLSQIKDFLGLNIEQLPGEFFAKIKSLFFHLNTLDVPTVLVSVVSLLLLLVWSRGARRFEWMRHAPAPLAVLVVMTAVTSWMHWPVETIGSRFGGIPHNIPSLSFPTLDLSLMGQLISPALTIALLGAIESLLSARVADGLIDDRHDPNQELMAQGVANCIAPLFGGFAATGAIARTATNVKTGGRTPIAGMVHALVLLAVVLALAPLASSIPLATLSAIVVVVSLNMGEWHAFKELKRYSTPYRSVLLSTFFVTVVFDLTLAVELGMVLASLFFIYRMSDLTHIERIPLEDFYGVEGLSREDGTPRILAFRVFGSLFFGAANKMESQLVNLNAQPNVVILDMGKVINIDTTGMDIIRMMHKNLIRQNAVLVLCELNDQPASIIRRSGFFKDIHAENVCGNLTEALIRAQSIESSAHPPL
ncbi:C4-dicarboxylic acid transporter DauA [Ephemeroptericola cinctiostellae]|uniref:C4-dicarboxylic acid transporter DauA n=1 Tax=Ephemeroptericola cinctiostellae TaxID=2268024 RepID=A0A345D7S9_9BURK|nr:sulfate permease [Ephemeroptericola cinctiostellae]AXF84417.1 C4-dicarboxylic acid transporter DauA [Ephemeroptericola cinctiostellae]